MKKNKKLLFVLTIILLIILSFVVITLVVNKNKQKSKDNYISDENVVNIENVSKLITFTIDNNNFKLDLVQKREKKQ